MMMQNFAAMGVITILWFLFVFSLCFGHTYYFFEDIWPSIADLRQYQWRRPLKTPDGVYWLCGTDPPGKPLWERDAA